MRLDFVTLGLIEKIVNDNPKVITIAGNTDPTYASSEFTLTLIDFGNSLYQTGSRFIKDEVVKIPKFEWLKNQLAEEDLQLRSFKNKYYVAKSFEDNINNEDIINISDYGGTISLLL